jgi:hypothetical protein
VAGEITLAAEVTPYAAAALSAYGAAVLAKAKDDLADTTVGAGRRVLQQIFGRRKEGEELPAVMAEVIENPGDEDYISALRLAIRKALESDGGLKTQVREIIDTAAPVVTVTQHVSADRDAYGAGRDMTITRDTKYAVEFRDAQGVQIGDHNVQRNVF